MKKRVLSLTLCLVFLLSSFGVQAFAATTYTDLIDDILQRYESADRSAESALQQQANGAYRCVELLYAISQELDDTGDYGSVADSVWDSFKDGDNRTDSAAQQLAHGLYRCVDLATVIAYELS